MRILAVTNNPIVKTACEQNRFNSPSVEARFVDGDAEALLITVRDMVYEGYALLTHPLPASMRMLFSPFRTVLLGEQTERPDPWHVETAETSVRVFRTATEHRTPYAANTEDYQFIDMQLLEAALKETQ